MAQCKEDDAVLLSQMQASYSGLDLHPFLDQLVTQAKLKEHASCFVCLVVEAIKKKINDSLQRTNGSDQVASPLLTTKMREILHKLIVKADGQAREKANENSLKVCDRCCESTIHKMILQTTVSPFSKYLLNWKISKLNQTFGRYALAVKGHLQAQDEHDMMDSLKRVIRDMEGLDFHRRSPLNIRSANSELDRLILEFDKMTITNEFPLEASTSEFARPPISVEMLEAIEECFCQISVTLSILSLTTMHYSIAATLSLDIMHFNLVSSVINMPSKINICLLCNIYSKYMTVWKVAMMQIQKTWNPTRASISNGAGYHIDQCVNDIRYYAKIGCHFLLQYCALYIVLHPDCDRCLACSLRFDLYPQNEPSPIKYPIPLLERMKHVEEL